MATTKPSRWWAVTLKQPYVLLPIVMLLLVALSSGCTEPTEVVVDAVRLTNPHSGIPVNSGVEVTVKPNKYTCPNTVYLIILQFAGRDEAVKKVRWPELPARGFIAYPPVSVFFPLPESGNVYQWYYNEVKKPVSSRQPLSTILSVKTLRGATSE